MLRFYIKDECMTIKHPTQIAFQSLPRPIREIIETAGGYQELLKETQKLKYSVLTRNSARYYYERRNGELK